MLFAFEKEKKKKKRRKEIPQNEEKVSSTKKITTQTYSYQINNFEVGMDSNAIILIMLPLVFECGQE